MPLAALKVPSSFVKKPLCQKHPPPFVIPLPRAKYHSFKTGTKWPECWVVWSRDEGRCHKRRGVD
jgi:hypothetical protein